MDLATPKATKVLGTLALLLVVGLGWLFVVGPETTALSDARAEVTATQDQNTVLATQLAALERQREDLGDTRRTARRLAEKFPATADQPGLFQEVTDAAVEAGIGAHGVTTLTPGPPVIGAADGTTDPAAAPTTSTDSADASTTGTSGTATGTTGSVAPAGSLARQAVTVSITGSYDETQRLLENLEHMPRAYLMTSVSLAGDAVAGTYTTTITGDMFVMPPVEDPGKTLDLASTTDPEGSADR